MSTESDKQLNGEASVSEEGILVPSPEASAPDAGWVDTGLGRMPEPSRPLDAARALDGGARMTDPELARAKAGEVTPVWIGLDAVEDDAAFRIRPEGDSTLLATDIARLGQLYPVDLRPTPEGRYQLICGFRRVAALKFLQREKVLARVHAGLSEEDSLLMALTSAIHAAPVSPDELRQMLERLESEEKLSPAARDMLEKALSPEGNLSPENVEEEVDADELADDVTLRLAEINQDLSLLADVFGSLDETRRSELLQQLRYSSELVAFLEEK